MYKMENHPKVHYITIATKPHEVLDKIKEKVAENGEEIHILGLSENRLIGWEGYQNFGVKLREVYDFLQNPKLSPNDIVLFTDAYDVAYLGTLAEVLRRYSTFRAPILFGCETQCNPDPDQASKYVNRDVEFSYLNSGMFIGPVWALRKCMEGYQYNDRDDDQRFWTKQFFAYPDLFELDYDNYLFLNTVDIEMESFVFNGKSAWYKRRNPLFVHVNGPDKAMIKTFL